MPVAGQVHLVIVPADRCTAQRLTNLDSRLFENLNPAMNPQLKTEVTILAESVAAQRRFALLAPLARYTPQPCRLQLVAAGVVARRDAPSSVKLLRTSTHSIVGMHATRMDPLVTGLEVLTESCGEVPMSDPHADLDADLDSDEDATLRVALQDLAASLRDPVVPLSWYVFNHSRAWVRRDFWTARLVTQLRAHGAGRVTSIVHGFGDGATSLARAVLFQLRHEFVCVVVKDPRVFESRRSSTPLSLIHI